MVRFKLMPLSVLCCGLSIALPAQAQVAAQAKPAEKRNATHVRITSGLNYSAGDYGDIDDTVVWSAPVSIKVTKGKWSARASIPYIHLSGPGSLIDGTDGTGSGGSTGSGGVVVQPAAGKRKVSGFGDVVIAGAYAGELGNDFYYDITAKIKLPTSSRAKRLGTGQVDVTAIAGLSKDAGPVNLFVEGRRRFVGNSDVTNYRDIWGATAGAGYRVNKDLLVGFDVDWQQSTIAGNTPSSEVTAWSSIALTRQLRLQIYGSTGLNWNSVDVAAGTSVSYRF